jgi:uncharacterized protein YceK
MRATFLVRAGLVILPILSGCATATNVFKDNDCKVYGGTRVDADLVSSSFGADPKKTRADGVEPSAMALAGCCGLVDMPFSFIADTVILPITVPLAINKGVNGQEAQAGEDGAKEKTEATSGRSAEK